jgi:hypothetical protein
VAPLRPRRAPWDGAIGGSCRLTGSRGEPLIARHPEEGFSQQDDVGYGGATVMPLCQRESGFYREQAKALREIAEKAPPGPERDKLLEIAAAYERLAERAELITLWR